MRFRRRNLALLVTLLLFGCQGVETTLDFKAQDEGHRLVVQGATSLPEQAPLLIWLQKQPLDRPLIEGVAVVHDHRFLAALPISPTLAEGPYVVRVFFTPRVRAWTPALREAVGPHGEKLHGGVVHRNAEGDRVIEVYQPVWIGSPGV